MNISVESRENNIAVITVSGRVDSASSSDLDNALKEHSETNHIVLDLAGVDFMSSAGLRALVSAKRATAKDKKQTVLVNPSSRVQEVLDLSGLNSVFDTYDTVDIACAIVVS